MQLKSTHSVDTRHSKGTSPLIMGNDETDRQCFQILCIIGPTKIARELGLKPQTVSGIIHRHYNLRRVIRYLEKLPHQLNTLNRIIKKSRNSMTYDLHFYGVFKPTGA